MKLHMPEYVLWLLEKRIAETRKLLAEAGFSSKHPLSLDLLYSTFETHQRIAITASSMRRENLGIGAKL